jgi:hypothetical protein
MEARMSRMMIFVVAALATSAALADIDTRCRVDSGGHRICVEHDRETKRVHRDVPARFRAATSYVASGAAKPPPACSAH